MKAIQHFSEEYLEHSRQTTPEQIIRFLDDFRQLHGAKATTRSKLISIKSAGKPAERLQVKGSP